MNAGPPHHSTEEHTHAAMARRSLHSALEQIAIVPAQLYGSPPRDSFRDSIDTKFTLGKKTVENPVEIDSPIMLGGVQEVYTDIPARSALIHGAGSAGTLVDMGWLGITDHEREMADGLGARTMIQLGPGRLVGSPSLISGTDALEISLIHSGSGSAGAEASSIVFPGSIAPELAELLDLDMDGPYIGPPRLMDMDTPKDLDNIVQLVREVSRHEIPVLIRLGSGRIHNDIRIAVNAQPDGIVLDCLQDPALNPTGHSTGIPALGMLAPAAQALADSEAEANDIKLIIAGDIRTAADIFKVMAFGFSGVMVSTAPLRHGGLLADPAGESAVSADKTAKTGSKQARASAGKKLDIETAGEKIGAYLKQLNADLKSQIAWTGHDSCDGIGLKDLRALTYYSAAVTGLKLIGYEKHLAMWEH